MSEKKYVPYCNLASVESCWGPYKPATRIIILDREGKSNSLAIDKIPYIVCDPCYHFLISHPDVAWGKQWETTP